MSDEESTQEIDAEALRERARSSISDPEEQEPTSTSSRRAVAFEDPTVMQPPARRGRKIADSISVEIDMNDNGDDAAADVADVEDVEDVSDDEDVSLLTNDSDERVDPGYLDRLRHPERYDEGAPLARFSYAGEELEPPPPVDDAPSMIGTMPGHDVAQALRAMMGDVPDTPLEDGDDPSNHSNPTWEPREISPNKKIPAASIEEGITATRLPHEVESLLASTAEEEALPAFSLDDDEPEPPAREELHSTSVTQTTTSAQEALSGLPPTRKVGGDYGENTSITSGSAMRDDLDRVLEQTRATDRGDTPAFPDPEELPDFASVRPANRQTILDDEPPIRAASETELPRFSLHSVLPAEPPPPIEPEPEPPPPPDPDPDPPTAYVPPRVEYELPIDASAFHDRSLSIDTSSFHDEEPEVSNSRTPGYAELGLDPRVPPLSMGLEEADIEEIVDDEIVEDITSTDAPIVVESPAPVPAPAPKPAPNASVRPPPAQQGTVPPIDPEEQELIDEQKWSLLVAHYRQKVATTDGPNRKAAVLLKIAKVYEQELGDRNETYNTLVDAFEIAPENTDVITQLDRVAEEAQRLGELADKVRKRMVPGASDEKRVAYLAHVVYWYERKLSKGNEVSNLISDIERHDKVHPLVLKRAAQISAMNGDVKTQRETLMRALERTYRIAEKVQLHLALASAWAGTPEAMKHYTSALELDPSSIVALQGVKRLGKEKELHAQVKWALERQADVAQTEAERIDAMLELAELEETKFLKRELAAQLLEQVLTIEPSHPQALRGLERCYHALRDWPALVRILAIRAEHAFEKRQKVELFELAAEVHESKLGDPGGAIEVYRNLLVVEPKHRRALTDLGRLYEKMGDWENMATYKARLAELAPSKRSSSQELLKLGDFLNSPDRDRELAKAQYEKAVAIDPTNAAAWEGIQRIAQDEGDTAKVLDALEMRKKHTDIPRQRAAVLVELARVQTAQGDEEAAKKSYEAAIRADSSNEAAAIYMLDAFTADERWSDAAPLCELLVNAAIRDRDNDALFIRLRLQTRIAAALGDADRALTASMAALDAQPMDPGAQADLLAVASQCSGSPSLARAKDHLARIAETVDDLTNEQIIKLAVLERELKDLDRAARCFEAARRREPENQGVTKQLAEIYLEQMDYPRACKLKVDMARAAPSGDRRFELFCEAGEIWAKRADELEKAASVFEEARQIKPTDRWLLDTLRGIYTQLSEWELVAGVYEDLLQIEESAPKKLELVLALAEVTRDQLQDPIRAVDALDRALDIDRKRLDLFEGVVRTLTEAKDWDRLERSYRKMIARVKDDDDHQLQFHLFHQLGLIYRDRLGDASRAFDALDAASRLEPDNHEVRKIVIELLIVTDNLDNAVARVRDEIERDPHAPELYSELYELFLRQHFFDKAWCCVNVLSRLKIPTADQRRFHEDYAPMPLDRVPGQIVEQAWKSHIFHADLDPALTNILSILTPAVARMRFGQLRPEQRVGRPFTPNHSRMHQAVRETFDNASEILALDAPELLVADLNSIHPFAPALAPFGAVLVCGPAIEAQSVSLVYLVGKKLAEQRPELAARAFFPNEKELGTLLASSMRVARNEGTKEPTGSALDSALAAALSPQETAQLRAAMMQALADNTAFDVKKWLQLADLSSMRAGLLIAGDIEPARQAIGCEVSAPSDLSPREKLGELLKFAVSDLYSDLRGAIGVSVQA